MKESKEKYNDLEKQKEDDNLKINKEKDNKKEDNLNIKYIIGIHDYGQTKEMICNKYITILELKKKIKLENNLNNKIKYILKFCGQIMKDKMRLIDFQINKYKEEKIFLFEETDEDLTIINISYNSMNTTFCFDLSHHFSCF